MDVQPGQGVDRRGRGRRWRMFGIVVAAGFVIAACAGPDPSSPSSASPSAPEQSRPTLLASSLLLSAQAAGVVMKASMADEGPRGDLPAVGVTVTPRECTGAFDPFDGVTMAQVRLTYTMATQYVVEQPRADRHLAQSATIFPSSSAAQRFFDRQTLDWKACARRALTAVFSRADKTQHHTLGSPVVTGDLITLSFGNDRRQCQRAIGMKAHVIVDVRACGPTIGSEGATVATAMLAKVPSL